MDEHKISYSITQKPGYYAHLWAKRVTGFNPEYHCVRSLRGSYVTDFPGPASRELDVAYAGTEDPRKFDFIYLCGVHHSYELDLNLHAPMRYAPGKVVNIETNGVVATFIDAELLIVPPLPSTFNLTEDEAFTRCRNYQFAYNAYGLDPGVIVLADTPSVELSDWTDSSIRHQTVQNLLFGEDE